jgi:aspartate dehydrogenase
MRHIKVGLIGCGSIGSVLAKYINSDKNFRLLYVLDVERRKCRDVLKKIKSKPRIVKTVSEMADADLIIEAASQECVKDYGLKILDHSDLMVMSVGAFSDTDSFEKMKRKAEENGRHVYIPSGAIPGLDGIKAAGMAELEKVTLTTRKPPKSLEGAPWVVEKDISLKSIRKPMVIFEGRAKEAARWFPKSVNVSIALSLAGIGVEKTKVRVMADPFTDRNVHEIEAEGKFGNMTLRTENFPSPGNRKTSYLAALSAIATLKKLSENIQIGT